MSRENPLWGAPRIHGELLKPGIDIVETMVPIDFFTVPTIRFQILYVSLVPAHERRRVVHFNVTAHPTAEWTAQQLREAFPWQRAFIERVIGTVRRECLDHVIVFNEASLYRHVKSVRGLLSRVENTPVAGQGCAGATPRPGAATWPDRCHTASWRSPPPVRMACSITRSGSCSVSPEYLCTA
jgi:hypothetical protein